MSKQIRLTQGKFAIVSDIDYPVLSTYKWIAITHVRKYRTDCYAYNTRVGSMEALIMFMKYGPEELKKKIVDHRNGNGLDNRRSNLRLSTRSQNAMNRRQYFREHKKLKNNYKGVSFRNEYRKKWRAYISYGGVRYSLGGYDTELEAARAYDKAAKKHHGAFAQYNFPDEMKRKKRKN